MDFRTLGIGYVIIFKIVLYTILLFGIFMLSGIQKVAKNSRGLYCTASAKPIYGYAEDKSIPECPLGWITVHSIANYGIENEDHGDSVAVILYVLLYWVSLSLILKEMGETSRHADSITDTPSDFAVVVSLDQADA